MNLLKQYLKKKNIILTCQQIKLVCFIQNFIDKIPQYLKFYKNRMLIAVQVTWISIKN